MWLFTRLSGLALIIMAAISMGLAFMMRGRTLLDMPTFYRWIFFPNPNHVVNSNIPDVSAGWSNAFWQIYSTIMIFLAAGHGLNGLRMVLEDYISSRLLTYVLRCFLIIVWISSIIVAIYVILAS
jgi:succinate dehydrogenase hydrophobic anchor subunit